MTAEPKLSWNPTPEQWDGIRSTGRSLLLSAAAGSGKTAVLAERCAYLVCDAEPRCDVDQLLVVTFTEAAAAEMKQRIERALRHRLDHFVARKGDDGSRLRRQLAQVDRAQVSTLHGFCWRLLRQHFHLLGLDPSVTILDGDEAALLRAEVARELFATRYAANDGSAATFQQFVDLYGDGDDQALRTRVVQAHELLGSLVRPQGWIAAARKRLADGAALPLHECDLGRELAAVIRDRLRAMRQRCQAGMQAARAVDGLEKYLKPWQELDAQLADWTGAFGEHRFDRLAKAVATFESPRKPTIRNAPAGKAAIDVAFDAVREGMKGGELRRMVRFSAEQWSEGLRLARPFADLFLDLVEQFGARYAEAKRRARGVDFNDLERLALRVLSEADEAKDELGPSAVARLCHRQFQHVLVDEYQDINEVQEAILRLVSRECLAGQKGAVPNLFCVGDVKQSIYRFRLADPRQFIERYEQFKSAGGATRGRVIDLQANFRSRKPLLDALNALFERTMTREAFDIEYDQSQALRAGKAYPEAGNGQRYFAGAPVEVHVLPPDVAPAGGHGAADDEAADPTAADADGAAELDRAEREASFIAHRIHELLGNMGDRPMCVSRGERLEPLRPSDIVILLRSLRVKADQYVRVLTRHKIPVHCNRNSGFFESLEVQDVLNLLAVLDNQRQDVPLAAVLRSPLAGLTNADDAMARMRLAYPRGGAAIGALPFHEAVWRYATEHDDERAAALREVLARLAQWRQMARRRPLAELLWHVYTESGYLAFVSGLDDGEQRVANLMSLHERAQQFGTFARQGLHRFIDFLLRLRGETDIGPPSALSAAEDAVRIMSIHRSKGLEFPVVFLPDLGKRINLNDARGSILLDRRALLGLEVCDEDRRARYPSIASTLVQMRLTQQALAEEMRVLYVATTRAREHLILVGTETAKTVDGWAGNFKHHRGPLPADVLLGGRTMFDWVGPAVASLEGSGHFQTFRHTPADVSDWLTPGADPTEPDGRLQRLAQLAQLDPPPPPHPAADAVIARLAASYPHRAMSRVQAFESVTSWAKRKTPGDTSGFANGAQSDATSSPALRAGAKREQAPPGPLDRLLPLPAALRKTGALAAADRGTATHLVLERLDFRRSCAGEDLRDQIRKLVTEHYLSEAQAKAVDLESIEWFIRSDVGALVCANARHLLRELPFNYAMPPQRFAPNLVATDPMDQVLMRGRIDLLVPVVGGFALVDYKTDRVAGAELDARAAFYGPQVELYREAVMRITGRPIMAAYLVFLHPRVVRQA